MSTLFTHTPQIPEQITYCVAAIQYEPTLGEKEKNIQALLRLIAEAISHGARLIVLPALATTGRNWLSREEIAPFVEPIPGPTTDRFSALAREHDCYIALSLPEVDAETCVYYNSMVLLGRDGIVGRYRQLHSSIAEPRWARDGDLGVPVWETPLGRLSALISMDMAYFETARIAALDDADVLLFPTNWGDERCPSGWWLTRAFENGVYLVAANRYGRERGVNFNGGSCIINPDGSIQSYLDGGEGIVYGQVDLRLARQKCWPQVEARPRSLLDDRRPEEYRCLVQNSYLWEPLRYHGLYDSGALPTGQLSCAGIVQLDLGIFASGAQQSHLERIQALHELLQSFLRDNAPAVPDILILPELLLPGPVPLDILNIERREALIAHFQGGGIQIPGPETDALVALANTLQVSMVLGVAERTQEAYYNTVLLIDPEGISGIYRKLHLDVQDRYWATPGNFGLPTFDTPTGRIGLATGYDVLFPETMRVLAGKGSDLVCVPALLNYPQPLGLAPTKMAQLAPAIPDDYDPLHFLIWRVRAAEHNVYLALANWSGETLGVHANGTSGIFLPGLTSYPWAEVVADKGELGLMLMTIDTREQRTGRRTTHLLEYSPGDMAGSLTGELAYNILDSIPGNAVRSKPFLRKRLPFWYLDLVRSVKKKVR